MRELAERRVAQLNGRIQGLESRLHQLAEENRALAARGPAASSGVSPQVCPSLSLVCMHHSHDTVGMICVLWSPQHMRACIASPVMSMQGVQAEHRLPCRHSGGECIHLLKLRKSAFLQVAERIGALEAELRRSKRREEKLAALQFRLREDLKQNGGNIG